MKIVLEGLEEGQVAVVAVVASEMYEWEDDPDPGEEEPEETPRAEVKAIGLKTVQK